MDTRTRSWEKIDARIWLGPDGRKYTIEPTTVTPEWAKEILYGNGGKEDLNFRRARQRQVDKIGQELIGGRWRFNGSSIAIDENGYVRDGRHRLLACIKTGISFDSLIVWGISDRADLTIDTNNLKRTTAQWLEYAGEKNSLILQSALSWIWRMRFDKELHGIAPTLDEADHILKENPQIRESASLCSHLIRGFPCGIACAVHALATKWNPSVADKFIKDLKTGANLSDKDPVYWLRNRILEGYNKKAKLPSIEIMALCIIAWNKWVKSEPTKTLKWTAIGPTSQPFPKLYLPPESAA